MNLTDDPEDGAFRAEFRAWLSDNLPPDWTRHSIGLEPATQPPDVQRAWQRRLYEGGWLKLGWPAEEGGRPATVSMQNIYAEELFRAGAPPMIGGIGVSLLGPTLRAYGSDWQKQQYLVPILRGDIVFCQGFSEPNAGSDLAGIRSHARRADGDAWILNGQKIWSSHAYRADRSFFLARTSPADPARLHSGIGFFLLDLHQPGVEVRPIRQLNGGGEFCEIFVTDALVAERDVVPGDGWKIAMTLLGFERGYRAQPERLRIAVQELARLLRNRGPTHRGSLRHRVVQAHIDAHVFRLNGLRAVSEDRAAEGSRMMVLSKLFWSELDKRVHEIALEIQGPFAALDPSDACAIEDGRWQEAWLWAQSGTIYSGTSEIQRNIIAERWLGLPRSR